MITQTKKQEGYEDIPEPTLPFEREEDDGHERVVLSKSALAEELKMSLISNVFFLIGGALFVGLAIWDINSASVYDDEYYDSSSEDDDDHVSFQMDTYTVLSIVASLAYLLNALTDVSWAIMDSTRPSELHSVDQDKSARWDVYSAIAFGLGAFVDLAASGFADCETPIVYNSDILSSQLYLFCSLFALIGMEWSFSTLSESLIAFGNLLFTAGSVIDVVLSFVNDPKLVTEDSMILAHWALVSAVLWFVDAILYLLSDLIELDCRKHESCFRKNALFWSSGTSSGKPQAVNTFVEEMMLPENQFI